MTKVTWREVKLALPADVSLAQVEAWLVLVPKLDPEMERAAYYVNYWNVPEKIRRARSEGWLPEGFHHQVCRRSMVYGHRPPGALTILFE